MFEASIIPLFFFLNENLRSPALQAYSLLSEPPEKPKNTGVDRLPLLQGNFLTVELNWGLRHCRRILYQLSHQGSPVIMEVEIKLR